MAGAGGERRPGGEEREGGGAEGYVEMLYSVDH